MVKVEKTVFISYRRTNLPWALAIYQNLTTHQYDVFFDYQTVSSGDFEQVILANIRARAHFLVLLTPSAIERFTDPDDWMRREIEIAIDTKRNIIPLFLEGFSFNNPSINKYLQGKLALLRHYNGLNVPADYFEEAMHRLRDRFLSVPMDAVLHPVSDTLKESIISQRQFTENLSQVKHQDLDAQVWFEKGFRYFETKDFDEAIRCYTESLRLKPDFAEAYYNRALAWEKKKDHPAALADYENYLGLSHEIQNSEKREVHERIERINRELLKKKTLNNKTR